MRRRTLVWQLFPVYFLITLASVLAIGFFALDALRDFYYAQTAEDLEKRACLIRQQLVRDDMLLDRRSLTAAVRPLAKSCGTRVTVIDSSGKVLADSDADPLSMENHADRPEFRRAIAGRTGTSRRYSPTLRKTMVYVAVPIPSADRPEGAIRVSKAAVTIDAGPTVVYTEIALAVAVTALIAGLASFLAARGVSVPLMRLRDAAERLAAGDLTARAPLSDTEEFAGLAETLNGMASRLDEQLRSSARQGREQQAILAGMKEGVIAVGADDRILILNPTAEQLLGISMDSARGKTVQEAIRHPGLQKFFETAYAGDAPSSEEIVLRGRDERLLQATGSALVDADGNRIGALVVLNDVTQTRKLENLRRDFVANVSHELKTPITSIKGFVETLRDGAIDDPSKAREFLEIVARQADRLNAIIEDLLALSAIEQRAEAAEIPKQRERILSILEAAVVGLETKAGAAGVAVSVQCPPDLEADVNAPLLEQAVTNLLDNAIKYSPSGSTVSVMAELADGDVAIHVADNGPGIEAEHIPRLFERFYRVDKARSRKQGGTGLGLAIVKHIVQAHGGRTGVKSAPGQGSVFSIYLPRTENPG